MKQKLMTIFSRTPVSVGAGQSVGAIDLPVMRERHTRIPIIPGSSIKGVLRDLWNNARDVQKQFFGYEGNKSTKEVGHSGKLFVGEARVLAFPVRSARGMFAWVTSPLALERFKRDGGFSFEVPTPDGMNCLASPKLKFNGKQETVLEEYCFNCTGGIPVEIENELRKLSSDVVWQAMPGRLAVISDEMFSYFVENACESPARIQIDDKTGVVGEGPFYQEQVPSETMFYNVLAVSDTDEETLDKVGERIKEIGGILQFGGDETIGLGYCTVELHEVEK